MVAAVAVVMLVGSAEPLGQVKRDLIHASDLICRLRSPPAAAQTERGQLRGRPGVVRRGWVVDKTIAIRLNQRRAAVSVLMFAKPQPPTTNTSTSQNTKIGK